MSTRWGTQWARKSSGTLVEFMTMDLTLKEDKLMWCAGCHDETPSIIANQEDVAAPEVIGDEDAPYKYGTGWGFFKTGHGVPNSDTIPGSGGAKNGPGKTCIDCHDPTVRHIDGDQRSFDCTDGCDSTEYQQGYRLKLIGGQLPMEMPRPNEAGVKAAQFNLCFSCHTDTDAWLVSDHTDFPAKSTNKLL